MKSLDYILLLLPFSYGNSMIYVFADNARLQEVGMVFGWCSGLAFMLVLPIYVMERFK